MPPIQGFVAEIPTEQVDDSGRFKRFLAPRQGRRIALLGPGDQIPKLYLVRKFRQVGHVVSSIRRGGGNSR
jgi:hypothetical protein